MGKPGEPGEPPGAAATLGARLALSPGALTLLLAHCSALTATLPGTNRGHKQEQQVVTTPTWPLCWEMPPVVGQCPRCCKCLLCSRCLSQTTSHLEPTQRSLLRGPLWAQQARERPNEEGSGATGALRGLREFSGVRWIGEHHCLCPPPPPQGRQGLYTGALACCQFSTVPSWTHHPRFQLQQREQSGATIITHTWSPHLALLWLGRPGPRCLSHPSAPTDLSKPLGTHSPHRGYFYIRPHFQDWNTELFCLIHIDKHRESNKMKRQNISKVKEQVKSPEKKS